MENAGISTGNPPACQTPRLTASARSRKMLMAGIDFAPRVDDGDHRLADKILLPVSELPHSGTMAEASHCGRTEPAKTAQIFRFLFGCHLFDQPRPTNGILFAITVMKSTLASSGIFAM